jgi:ferric iron reductase protein FhuF
MPLQQLTAVLRAAEDGGVGLTGLHPTLRADGHGDWQQVNEELVTAGVAATAARYSAPPHVAAALWWKAYSYWATLPVALGWALGRRVPLMSYDDTVVRPADGGASIVVALRSVRVAVMRDDPLAGAPETVVAADEAELVSLVRASLLHSHLAPVIATLQQRTRVGTRTLWGSVAEAVTHPLVAYGVALTGRDQSAEAAGLLAALGPPVAGLADVLAEEPGLRRRTCCLWAALDQPPCPTCCILPRMAEPAA